MVTKQYSPPLSFSSPRTQNHVHPLSSSQALFLLASPQARRGVRVGSICLCDGHWCQAPWGLEGEERRLMWSRRVTDVSELSSGTLNGAESWGWSWGKGEGLRERARSKGLRREGADDGGTGSRLRIVLRLHRYSWGSKCGKWCWTGLYPEKLDLSFSSTITIDCRGTFQGASFCPETMRMKWQSQSQCPRCLSGITRENLREKERKEDL